MTARDALKVSLRENFAPTLRAAGFRGTYPTWRRTEPSGDVAIVNVQPSVYNEGDLGEFYVNLAVVPAPWWIWQKECLSRISPLEAAPGKLPMEYNGLYRARLAPKGTRTPGTYQWVVDSVDGTSRTAAAMAAALEAQGLPALQDFLTPGKMLEAVRSGHLEREAPAVVDRPGMKDVVMAVLLSEVGGRELDAVCERLDRFDGAEGWREVSVATVAWAKDRAAITSTP
jgi:hypothetical protein